ncbi:serine hydrolase FSH [Clohesyomyces aquaticus]|uniref:Serine hydrolase FSH n=1 Tax=Clohesyomyces aquaticus TaxID=1231657 RepID=A0A1Y1Y6U9_9PLEO|nr:serine hydrolase FSH [Clohesyomyces aquaticus]
MRFICLHGKGTSSQILQMQTAALRHELGEGHVFEFVGGTVQCPMAPEIAHISNPDIPHYEYFAGASSYLGALQKLEEYIQHHGPYDGVLGFSQGAGLALMYLIRHSHLYPRKPLPFRVAILFSRIGVYNPAHWMATGEAIALVEMPQGLNKLNIPVAAIWGENDWDLSKSEAANTKGLVRENCIWSFVHEGEHEIPRPAMKGSVLGAVKVIKRAIAQARMG